jgi:hypothetical protein
MEGRNFIQEGSGPSDEIGLGSARSRVDWITLYPRGGNSSTLPGNHKPSVEKYGQVSEARAVLSVGGVPRLFENSRRPRHVSSGHILAVLEKVVAIAHCARTTPLPATFIHLQCFVDHCAYSRLCCANSTARSLPVR